MIDAESIVRDWAAGEFPADRVVTELPAEWAGRIMRVVGGPGSNNLTLDRVLIDVDCFAASRDGARKFAEETRDAFMALSHSFIGPVAVTIVETTMRPHWIPWDNTDVRRFAATYQLYLA